MKLHRIDYLEIALIVLAILGLIGLVNC